MSTSTLSGRTALVTGAGRRAGIGFAVAARLARMGASIVLHHHAPHDDEQPWGRDDLAAVRAALGEHLSEGASLHDVAADLADPEEPARVIEEAAAWSGHLDILVCNHARSGGDGPLAEIDADQLDGHWHVNTRATLLLTQAFARRHDGRKGGRVIWMTSGQQLGPLRGEIAYGASKAALAGLTATVADELIDRGIILNTVNPGPVDTGYLGRGVWLPDEVLDDIESRFPTGRVGRPDDPARLIAWLVSDEGRWMVGQVLNTEGGFRRS
ncbi:SDR family oxidoreductase [Georgenia alba]|uniref:SDR family oxidoreductase n=1 Tax=Georgenia alba TaxID=2233858 RepID=A0ABW2QAR4_9MICO